MTALHLVTYNITCFATYLHLTKKNNNFIISNKPDYSFSSFEKNLNKITTATMFIIIVCNEYYNYIGALFVAYNIIPLLNLIYILLQTKFINFYGLRLTIKKKNKSYFAHAVCNDYNS